jgi:hypothetical protein
MLTKAFSVVCLALLVFLAGCAGPSTYPTRTKTYQEREAPLGAPSWYHSDPTMRQWYEPSYTNPYVVN